MSDQLALSFDHVHLLCTDLAASERWFIEGMGAELVRRRHVGDAPATDLRLGGTTVLLRAAQSREVVGPPGPSRFGTDHFGFEVKDLNATVEELKRRGVEVVRGPEQVASGLRIAFVRGPDQVSIELVQR